MKKLQYKKTGKAVKLEIDITTDLNGKTMASARLTHKCGKENAIRLIKEYINLSDKEPTVKA